MKPMATMKSFTLLVQYFCYKKARIAHFFQMDYEAKGHIVDDVCLV